MDANKLPNKITPGIFRNLHTPQNHIDTHLALENMSLSYRKRKTPQQACDDLMALWNASAVHGKMNDGRHFMYFMLPPPSETISESLHVLLSELTLEKKHQNPLSPMRVCFGIFDPNKLDVVIPCLEKMQPDTRTTPMVLAKRYIITVGNVASAYLCTNKGVLNLYWRHTLKG